MHRNWLHLFDIVCMLHDECKSQLTSKEKAGNKYAPLRICLRAHAQPLSTALPLPQSLPMSTSALVRRFYYCYCYWWLLLLPLLLLAAQYSFVAKVNCLVPQLHSGTSRVRGAQWAVAIGWLNGMWQGLKLVFSF